MSLGAISDLEAKDRLTVVMAQVREKSWVPPAAANPPPEPDASPPSTSSQSSGGSGRRSSWRRVPGSTIALGGDQGPVMDEMGHSDPALALRVYRQAMRRGEDEKAALRALVEGGFWRIMAHKGKIDPPRLSRQRGHEPEKSKNPALAGLF